MFLHFLLLTSELHADVKSSNYKVKFKGRSLSRNVIISEHEVTNVVECALLCVQTETCLGFHYKTTTTLVINCQLSNETNGSKTNHSDDEWTFYQDVATHFSSKYEDNVHSPKTPPKDVIVTTCNHSDEKQWWTWTTCTQIQHQESGKCLDVNGGVAKLTKLHLSTCDSSFPTQQWSCSDYFVQLNGTDFYMEYGVLSGAEIYLSTSTSAYGQWQISNFTIYNICFAKP
ncbi:uncharacterized protein LOC114530671 isoform X2 [Dendronephthya gigantea]|uniref:uncharacterized protein LOC114530671 isoform X2 n=1 Tax=Dendronephthya gigantea TaxID=151771 RepID=UPI00106B1987|nr:uncharacterized protein LOC114530671 isoform X2 [Dendronephthya gigantea]